MLYKKDVQKDSKFTDKEKKWQRVTTSGTMSGNDWQQLAASGTANHSKWWNEWQQVKLVELNPKVQCIAQKFKMLYGKFTG